MARLNRYYFTYKLFQIVNCGTRVTKATYRLCVHRDLNHPVVSKNALYVALVSILSFYAFFVLSSWNKRIMFRSRLSVCPSAYLNSRTFREFWWNVTRRFYIEPSVLRLGDYICLCNNKFSFAEKNIHANEDSSSKKSLEIMFSRRLLQVGTHLSTSFLFHFSSKRH